MTSKIEVPRELLEEVVAQLDDFITGDVLERLKSVLAAPEAPRQSEPVAYQRKWDADGIAPYKEKNENGRMAWAKKFIFVPISKLRIFPDDVALYAEPQAPLSPDHSGGAGEVVLPERRKPMCTGAISDFTTFEEARGWNACLDKIKELNQ
jgi:hypothetical protein